MLPPATFHSMTSKPILSALLLGVLSTTGLSASLLDTVIFGNDASEAAHEVDAPKSKVAQGGLGEPARTLLPEGGSWKGGVMKFLIKVDPQKQNYFTIRLWGEDVNHNQMTLHVQGKQLGYRHLGDYEVLEIGADGPAYPGRFIYRTCPLPLDLTKGKDRVTCEIRATGPIWGYGTSFEQYQKPMTDPTRGIYRAYSHTDGCFTPPTDEKQGVYPENSPVRTGPGPEVLDAIKSRINGQIAGLLNEPKKPCNQMQMLFLAKAWHTLMD